MLLYTLQDKLETLIKAHKALKEKESLLQKKVDDLESLVENLKSNINQLEEAMVVQSLGSNADKNALKQYIDSIISEIELAIKKL